MQKNKDNGKKLVDVAMRETAKEKLTKAVLHAFERNQRSWYMCDCVCACACVIGTKKETKVMNFFYKAKIAYETKQETASENVVSSLRTNQNKYI